MEQPNPPPAVIFERREDTDPVRRNYRLYDKIAGGPGPVITLKPLRPSTLAGYFHDIWKHGTTTNLDITEAKTISADEGKFHKTVKRMRTKMAIKSKPAPTKESAFLKLPREIRENIFSKLIEEPEILIIMDEYYFYRYAHFYVRRNPKLGVSLSLLLTNKQIAEEAISVVFRTVTFHLRGDMYTRESWHAQRKSVHISYLSPPSLTAIANRIRHLQVTVALTTTQVSGLAHRHMRIFRLLRHCYELRSFTASLDFNFIAGDQWERRSPFARLPPRPKHMYEMSRSIFAHMHMLLPKACRRMEGPITFNRGTLWLMAYVWDDEVIAPDWKIPGVEDLSDHLLFVGPVDLKMIAGGMMPRMNSLEKRQFLMGEIPREVFQPLHLIGDCWRLVHSRCHPTVLRNWEIS